MVSLLQLGNGLVSPILCAQGTSTNWLNEVNGWLEMVAMSQQAAMMAVGTREASAKSLLSSSKTSLVSMFKLNLILFNKAF